MTQPPLDPDRTAHTARKAALTAAWVAAVPARFRDARLADFDPDPTVRDPLGRWTDGAWLDGVNLLVTGNVGTGKTHAAFGAARVPFAQRTRLTFWPMGELLRALDWRDPDHNTVMRRACTIGLLILDDLGAELPSDWSDQQIYTIVNARWSNDLPTIGTTNLTSTELENHLGDRTFSRLVGSAIVVRLNGPDLRRARP